MINDADQLTRVIMGNVPAWLATAFYAMATAALVWAAWGLGRRVWRHSRGRSRGRSRSAVLRSKSWKDRLLAVLRHAPFHRKMAHDRFAGVAHALVFYGFVILFIGTCLVFLEHSTPLHFFYGRFYLMASLVIDLGGAAFLVGLGMFLYRRLMGKSTRILQRRYVAALAWLLLAIGLTGFLLEGARIAVDLPQFERWSLVGYGVARGLTLLGVSGETALAWHRAMWGLHAVLCIAFFALLPWKFFSHMIFSPVSWVLRSQKPRSELSTIPLLSTSRESGESGEDPAPGVVTWPDFSWIDLLHADACTTCGRCNDVCPAHAAGKPLRPREVVLGVRQAMHAAQPAKPATPVELSEFIDDDTLWSCTTCGACNQACPVGIDVYDKIVDLRRGRVEQGVIPASAASRFDSAAEQYNPFNKPNANRLDWAAGLDVPVAEPGEPIELLYWVGCAGSFDPEGRGVSQAMIKILNHLGVNYSILGKRERCTGDPVRRMGEEGLFQSLAEYNAKLLAEHGVARIVTHCPHCFNTFRNEYPQLHDVTFEVEHHSMFLERMIAEGRLELAGQMSKTITFHDPCYLGRGNNETAPPRATLDALQGVTSVEMPRHGENSFCCGAGGGSLWLDIAGTDRIENERAAEATGTGADALVTGCPFCKGMLEAGCQSLEEATPQVIDLAELVVQAEGL